MFNEIQKDRNQTTLQYILIDGYEWTVIRQKRGEQKCILKSKNIVSKVYPLHMEF